jgi:hypothetical protein
MGWEERGEAMMTKEQIIAAIIDCLDHQLCSAMGHMQDKYYKGEFFHLFAEAYNHGFMADKSLTGSSLWDIIGERWFPLIWRKRPHR